MWEKINQVPEKFRDVRYEIRGPLLDVANRLIAEGKDVIRLNIGNPKAFGFDGPEVLIEPIAKGLQSQVGYGDAKGLLAARQAIIVHNNKQGIIGSDPNNVFIGNGVSELILNFTNALLSRGDSILIPSPDYPLWTAATNLAGGTAIHYLCKSDQGWIPDLEDIKSKITPQTKAILVINPNNPTGAVYSKEILLQIVDLARQHQLLIFADEIYDNIIYDGRKHVPIASLAVDVPCVTFNGLSKNHRLCGLRVGWAHLTGPVEKIGDYLNTLNLLASMRLCSNMPNQLAIELALTTDTGIKQLVESGRLKIQRDIVYNRINNIDGLSVQPLQGSLYAFIKIDLEKFDFEDDYAFVWSLLNDYHVLVVHSDGFNWQDRDHFRLVYLADQDLLNYAIDQIEKCLAQHRKYKG